MKNSILRGGLLLVIITLSIACNQKKEEAAAAPAVIDKEQIKAEIQALEDHFALTYNTRNVADAMDYYADDATSYFNNRMPIVGKDSIEKIITEELADFPKGAKISFTTKEVYSANEGKHVFEIGSYKVVDSTNTKIRGGNYFSLFEKRNGKYVCVRDMANSTPE